MILLDNVRALSAEEFKRRLTGVERGQCGFELNTANCIGKSDFFEAVRQTGVPLDPELVHENWDAMADSMRNGLADLRDPEVLVFWMDYNESTSLPQAVKYQALRVFVHVADQLAVDYPDSPAKDLWLFLRKSPGAGGPSSERVSIPRPPDLLGVVRLR